MAVSSADTHKSVGTRTCNLLNPCATSYNLRHFSAGSYCSQCILILAGNIHILPAGVTREPLIRVVTANEPLFFSLTLRLRPLLHHSPSGMLYERDMCRIESELELGFPAECPLPRRVCDVRVCMCSILRCCHCPGCCCAPRLEWPDSPRLKSEGSSSKHNHRLSRPIPSPIPTTRACVSADPRRRQRHQPRLPPLSSLISTSTRTSRSPNP